MTNGLAIPSKSQSVLINDNGCDQSIVTYNDFRIGTYFEQYYDLSGPLQG